MSLAPKVKQILLPPAVVPSKNVGAPPSEQLAAVTHLTTFRAKSSPRAASIPTQNHLCSHPVQPLVAYVLENSSVSANKVVTVQNTVTQEIVYSLHWLDLAAAVYGENDPQKLPAAAKALGQVVSLQFYDASVLFWSRLCLSSDITNDTTQGEQQDDHSSCLWQILAVQTDRRILMLNLRRGPTATHCLGTVASTASHATSLYQTIRAHLCEKTIGGVPSSNLLAVTERCVLTGCTDGSLKCYDWRRAVVTKKIKGLGKGDSVLRLLPANPLHTRSSSSSSESATASQHQQAPRRILTVTKKGSVYLIELVLGSNTIDIQPPLARFQVTGQPELSMEACTIRYDGHTDRVFWSYNDISNNEVVLHVWNLKALQPDFVKNRDTKSIFKPEASMVIHLPAGGGGGGSTSDHHAGAGSAELNLLNNGSRHTLLVPGLVHPAFGEDTVVSVTITASGVWALHGANATSSSAGGGALSTTAQPLPVAMAHVKQLIVNAAMADGSSSLTEEDVETAEFRVHAVTAAPLGCTGPEVTVATNWGLVVLGLPLRQPQLLSEACASISSGVVASASRHLHFGAGLGSLGKSSLMVQHSAVQYASLDVLQANPVGWLEPKNPVTLYESSPLAAQNNNMPAEFVKRPFRLAPVLLPSPTGVYIALVWPCEYRYEILHTSTLLQQVGQLRTSGSTAVTTTVTRPVVASGTGVGDFAWVSDEDVFAVLHAPDWQELAALQVPKQQTSDGEAAGSLLMSSPNLKLIGAGAMGVANLATSVTKGATGAATNAANMTVGVTTKAIRSGAKGVTKGVKKSLGLFGGKKKRGGGDGEGSIITADDDEDESSTATGSASLSLPSAAELEALRSPAASSTSATTQARRVELKRLEVPEQSQSQPVELSGGIAAATCVSLGDVSLRGGGNRNPPTMIFGGPVLCVASRSEEDKDGHAHFYAKKQKDGNGKASSYQSSGPALPYPDLVSWDDDGRLCAIVVANRVAVYLLAEADFVLLGTVRIGSPSVPTAAITSVKFLHGALYCCTWDSVHCVLLGNLEYGICYMDAFLLASTNVPMLPESKAGDSSETYTSFSPSPVSLPLVQPSVLGYQSGSLIVSTLRGVHAIPLNSPLMRIGLFLASDQVDRATRWFDAVPNSDHEALAVFLERRGEPELAVELPGLSLETIVDFSMRHGYVDRLEEIVETYGVGGLRAIDMGRGLSASLFGPDPNAHSVVVCVGAYLLSHGRVELARRLASECLHAGEEGKKDAFLLGTLLLQVNESDATRLLQRTVGDDTSEDWLIGNFARDYVL